ncbi:hypothetical protein H0H92_011111 [Tricholoma furcatifolium]|nr:hypothetical protein H0H92_011111 [Tricholoma furcatifolium]
MHARFNPTNTRCWKIHGVPSITSYPARFITSNDLRLDPGVANCTLNGDTRSLFFNFSCPATVVDTKSPRDPESISARTGWPSSLISTTTGSGIIRDGSLGTLRFLSIDAIAPEYRAPLVSSQVLQDFIQ